MFNTAKTLDNKAKAPSKGKQKDEIRLPGLEDLAVADALIKNFTSYKATLKTPLDELSFTTFLARTNGARPTNFRGVDGDASASIELRKRSTNSPLTETEVELLKEKGIPFATVTDVTGTFVINPDALSWLSKNADKVEKALAGIKGLPKDFILKQEAVTRNVVSDETVEKAFELRDEEAIRVATLVAIKPTLTRGLTLDKIKDVMTRLFGAKLDKLKDQLKASLKAS